MYVIMMEALLLKGLWIWWLPDRLALQANEAAFAAITRPFSHSQDVADNLHAVPSVNHDQWDGPDFLGKSTTESHGDGLFRVLCVPGNGTYASEYASESVQQVDRQLRSTAAE
ncbi:hypothetical protein FOZ62_012816 [Perkinsus olseni]|uniref:Uncharacterized protein n=1 Tax=Perkinsus olseni TaxID=32597 RepID=A0A7J6R1M8_PEROL|nr:hypothetical protein FOZ62_012816 [Perkinsus olseni]